MRKGVKTRLKKPTDIADLNKRLLMDSGLIAGKPVRTVPDSLNMDVKFGGLAIYEASGSGSVFIPSIRMDFGSPFHIKGQPLSLDTWERV